MRIAKQITGTIFQLGKRLERDRVTLCRFHNSVYLGCVIGTLVGAQLCHAAITWPIKAWQQRVRPRMLRLSGDFVRSAVTRARNQMRLEHVDAAQEVRAA